MVEVNKAQKYDVYLEKVVAASDTASLFRFKFKEGVNFNFTSGQYIWLIFDKLVSDDPRGERRAFSIVSSDKENSYIEILSRASDSGYKKTLTQMKQGDQAYVFGPFGYSFTLPENNKKNIVFIAGGVAVAPFFSILNSIKEDPVFSIKLFHFVSSNKSCNNDFIKDKIKALKVDMTEVVGRFEGKTLEGNVDFSNDQFYVTGPQGFVDDVGAFLKQKGVPKENCHYEEFYPAPPGNLTEDVLEKEEDTLTMRAIMDSKSHTIITDANGLILFANPKAEENTGFKFSEMRGNTPRLWGGLMSKEFYEAFWKKKHQKDGFDGEITNHRKDGKIYIVMAHISPISDKEGNVIGYIGTEEDVTTVKTQKETMERKNIELEENKAAMLNVLEDLADERNKLSEKEAELEEAQKIGRFGNFVWNLVSNDVFWSDEAFKMHGWEPTENHVPPPMDDYFGVIHEDDRDKAKQSVENALKSKTENRYVYRVVWKDGSVHFIKVISKLEFDIDGNPKELKGTFQDVTREMEVDQAKTEFVSLASHQLRTPLSTINWYAEMLLSGDAGEVNEEQKKYLDEIYKGNQRMVDLVNSLLNVSRLELGTFLVEPEPTNLVELAESVIKELEPQIKTKEQVFEKQFGDNIPIVPVDPKLTRMIFQNLLSNAVKYTNPKGNIKCSVILNENAKTIDITVSDSGMGIPEDQKKNIFSKLFRADNVRQTDTEGTGLGLYIVKSILDNTGGSIRFDSKEGEGTTFYVSIPSTGMQKKDGTKTLS